MPHYQKDYLDNVFKYHKPDYEKGKAHALIRHECHKLAGVINELCPISTETVEAIKHIQSAMFWANASLARH